MSDSKPALEINDTQKSGLEKSPVRPSWFSFKEVKKDIFLIFVGFLVGGISDNIKKYIDRPKLNFQVNLLAFKQEVEGQWEGTIKYTVSNKGGGPTYFSIKDLTFCFPEYEDSIIAIDHDFNSRIDESSILIDSIRFHFPSIFETDTLLTPALNYVEFYVEMQKYSRNQTLRFDSTKIKERVFISAQRGIVSPSTFKTLGRFKIEHEGQEYNNYFYPPNLKIQISMRDGKYYLRAFNNGLTSKQETLDTIVETYFMIDPSIKQLVVLPDKTSFHISSKTEDKNQFIYRDYTLDLGGGQKRIFYFFSK